MIIKFRKTHRGGKREGAGRPTGTGKYGEPTKAVRIPQSLVPHVQHFLVSYGQTKDFSLLSAIPALLPPPHRRQRLPLFDSKVAAGFPSPADDHTEIQLDLNEYVIKNPATTFYVRVEGESMKNAGIFPNDLLVVDRSLTPMDGNIVIALVDGEFTVKRLRITKYKEIWLLPENEAYSPLHIKDEMEFRVWGIVTNVIHSLLTRM